MIRLIVATSSEARRRIMAEAGLDVEAFPARIDEEAVRAALEADQAHARDIADALAEMKARKIAERHPDALVIGFDQILAFEGRALGKPENPETALDQLRQLRGNTHKLLSAAVVYENARPVWRHVAEARMMMRQVSDAYLEDYIRRNWDSIRHTPGGYKLEEEGVRLFEEVQGDWFTVMGLPLLPLLGWLTQRGFIDG